MKKEEIALIVNKQREFFANGMGAYHGKTGFDTFSHKKSIVDKKTWIDLPMRYQPYKKFYGKLLHIFLK